MFATTTRYHHVIDIFTIDVPCMPGVQVYCAAKHAQVGLTRQLSHELGTPKPCEILHVGRRIEQTILLASQSTLIVSYYYVYKPSNNTSSYPPQIGLMMWVLVFHLPLMSAVCFLLFSACCLLSAIYYLLSVICYHFSVVCCLLSVCLLSAVCGRAPRCNCE